ncbi:hypothetical protein [Marimonas lutisalis]|uniref:hypothetical protein n=1 Tax=Marimonas lutisalis TaxID=2545756 RepID=UPI0010F9D04C|nr:hypothetical protein [Marimonas lutisalis]
MRRLVRECKARKFETIGIMFMRNRFQFARSHYREWVQNWNNALPFPKYVKERRKQWDFVAIAERMNRIFDGNMHYHSYVPGHDTVKVFTDLLSLPKLAPVQLQNPSLNAIEAEAARLLIEQGVKDYQPHLEAKRTRLLALAGDGGVKAFSEDLDQKPLRETRGEAQRLMQATNLPEDEVRALLDLPHKEAEKIIRLRGDIAREIGLAA